MTSPLFHRKRAWVAALGWGVLAAAILAAQAPEGSAGPLEVRGVRHWKLGDSVRVAIEVSGEFQYRHGRLSNPDRVYFDIVGARQVLSRERVHTIPVGDRLLKQIRVSQTRPDITRVVFDLEQPVNVSAAQLANPDRLVVELRARADAPEESPAPAPAPPPETAKPPEERVPLPAKKSVTGSRSLVRALGLKLARVVIDPGHGGGDTGTIGPSGVLEKDLVLDVALRLGAVIEERLGAEVVYTRTGDVSVPLEERTALANEKKADLFLSIHANAGTRSATGSESYYLNFSTDRSAMEVAARENASSQRTIHDLQGLIEKIALKDKVEESREFAARIQTALCKELARSNSASRDRGVRKAPFLVLIGAAMPSVLTEIAFLSNPHEERLLKSESYRQKIAEGLYTGLSQYALALSRFQVAEKKNP
jgi:N-acetylmuramoyl-L-alanine amidase